MSIRVLIADTRPIVCIGMRLNLDRAGNIEVVGETAEFATALDLVKSRAPDVIIVGNSFALPTAHALAESVVQQFPKTRFVVLTDNAPATGTTSQITYLPPTCTGNELVAAVLRH